MAPSQAYQHASDDLKADRNFALTVAGRTPRPILLIVVAINNNDNSY